MYNKTLLLFLFLFFLGGLLVRWVSLGQRNSLSLLCFHFFVIIDNVFQHSIVFHAEGFLLISLFYCFWLGFEVVSISRISRSHGSLEEKDLQAVH